MAGLTANMVLGPDDPMPVGVFNAEGTSPFLLIGDHAGWAIPQSLGDLGLGAADRERHIALDIGVLGLGQAMSAALDAPFVHQAYSRLVVDCNRDPARADTMPAISDGTVIPGNQSLDAGARQARIAAIHQPYHAALARILDARQAAGQPTILLSLHSFTPVMDGIHRPWHVGVLYWAGQSAFALALRDALASDRSITVGDNVPYTMDETDYTVPLHAFARSIPYAEIELRQDLIPKRAGQEMWAARLSEAAGSAYETCLT